MESEPNQDTDGDGWVDEIETFLVQTQMMPMTFSVKITSEQAVNPQQGKFTYHLKWSSLAGRTYTIQSSSNLSTWSNEAELEGNDEDLTHTLESEDKIGFFRLQIE